MKKIINCTFFLLICFSLSACEKSKNSETTTNPDIDIPDYSKSPLPFDMPSLGALRAGPKRVFAHYFPPQPIQLYNNRPPEEDYYAVNYLSPNAQSPIEQRWNEVGGFLRNRPLPVEDYANPNFQQLNYEKEVKYASEIGIDGFAVDILRGEPGHLYYDAVGMLCDAAQKIDLGFKILLMPDMSHFHDKSVEYLVNCVNALCKHSSIYRLEDGRLVVSPFNTHRWNAEKWTVFLDEMRKLGEEVAFFPLFQEWKKYAVEFAPISYGMSDWGSNSINAQSNWLNSAELAHSYGAKWMMPVRPQDVRPKNSTFWEARNSEMYRVTWENAIESNSDWVQIITWNDYTEHTSIVPSTGTYFSFADLTSYYITWYKTGVAPPIVRDVLYYFYRPQLARAPINKQQVRIEASSTSDPVRDEIELLAFLKSAGTLEIEIDGKKNKVSAQEGVTSFKIPATKGIPTFRLIRNDKDTIINFKGKYQILDEVDYQNPMYYGGSNSRIEDYSPVLDYKQVIL